MPIGVARIAREGTDITIVSAMNGVHESLKAAEQLAGDGIAAEVIDLRTLRPLDIPTVLASVAKTNRIVVVEEGPLTGGWAGEVSPASPRRASAISTMPGASPRPTAPCRTRPRSRTPSSPGADADRLGDPRATHPEVKRDIEFTSGGETVRGWLYTPDSA